VSTSAAACDTGSRPDRFPAGGAVERVTRLSGRSPTRVGYGEPVSRQRTILVLAVASQAAFSMVTFGLPAIGAEIRERFDLGPAGFGAVFAAVGLGSAAALIPAGALIDRFGGRRVLIVGGIVNGVGLLLAAAAGSAATFAAALVLAGIGGSAVPVAGMTALLRVFEPERRGRAMGWRQLGVPLGGTVGAAVLPALAAVGGVRLAMAGAGLAAAATALAFAAVSDGRPAAIGISAGQSVAGVLRIPGFKPLLAVGLLYVLALGAILAHYVGALRAAGLSHTEAAAGFTALNITAALSRIVWGRVADAGGGTRRARTLRDVGILTVAATTLMPLALAAAAPVALVAGVVVAFGAFGMNGVLYLLAGELAGPSRAGRAVGVASTVVFGMGALAAPIAGFAIERTGYDAVWVLSAVVAAAGSLTAWRWLEPAAVVTTEAEIVQVAAPAR
jgi:MFS family permease